MLRREPESFFPRCKYLSEGRTCDGVLTDRDGFPLALVARSFAPAGRNAYARLGALIHRLGSSFHSPGRLFSRLKLLFSRKRPMCHRLGSLLPSLGPLFSRLKYLFCCLQQFFRQQPQPAAGVVSSSKMHWTLYAKLPQPASLRIESPAATPTAWHESGLCRSHAICAAYFPKPKSSGTLSACIRRRLVALSLAKQTVCVWTRESSLRHAAVAYML